MEAHPTRSRAVFRIDYTRGAIDTLINPSCTQYFHCRGALKISSEFSRWDRWRQHVSGNARNRIRFEFEDRAGIEIHYDVLESALGAENGRQDMIVCFRPGLSQLQTNDVVTNVLTIPQPDGSEALPSGVDGFAYDFLGEEPSVITVLEIDFYSNASKEDEDALGAALLERDEVVTVLRDARASDCEAATSTTS